jgi:hypothetical protein
VLYSAQFLVYTISRFLLPEPEASLRFCDHNIPLPYPILVFFCGIIIAHAAIALWSRQYLLPIILWVDLGITLISEPSPNETAFAHVRRGAPSNFCSQPIATNGIFFASLKPSATGDSPHKI